MTGNATPRSFAAKISVPIDESGFGLYPHMIPQYSTQLVLTPPASVTLPVIGSEKHFPVGRVFCIGRNYPWSPEHPAMPKVMPSWFMKPASAVFSAKGTLPFPPETNDFCHEVELVVGISQGGTQIPPRDAEKSHVWGYAVGLDLTRRDLQQLAKKSGAPWEPAKAFDFSAPCSAMVPFGVCGPVTDNAIWLKVNGVQRQKAKVSDMLFSVSELISMLSHSVRLQPGDLIFTGTPVGVDVLKPNDVIQAGVAGIAEISMQVGEFC
jgi:fumarylpyruvate hydrolase